MNNLINILNEYGIRLESRIINNKFVYTHLSYGINKIR